jgi:hypothetical protein
VPYNSNANGGRTQGGDSQETHITPFDASRSGRLLLAAGIILYLIVFGASATLLGFESKAGARVLGVLIVPVAFAGMILLLVQFTLFVGIVIGVPWLSLASGLSLIKRDWMTIVGCTLLIASLCATLAAVMMPT